MTTRPLPYLQVKTVRGRPYHYFRHAGIYQRLPGAPGDAAYHARYAELLALVRNAPASSRPGAGSVAALITDYKAAPEFRRLAPKTRRDYARALDLLAPIGPFPAERIARADIVKLRNKVAARSGHRAADLFAAVVGRLFAVGVDLGYVEINRFGRIERLADTESHAKWPPAVRAAFLASAPPVHLVTAYMLALWTALRRSDIVRIGRQHDDGTALTIRPEKTRARTGVEVYVPVFHLLREHLDTLPAGRLLYVARADGTPVSADALSHELARHMAAIGHGGYTLHGLRHTSAVALAEAGASAKEIQAILGHTTLAMSERYTAQADRRRLAVSGMAKLGAGASRKPSRRNGDDR